MMPQFEQELSKLKLDYKILQDEYNALSQSYADLLNVNPKDCSQPITTCRFCLRDNHISDSDSEQDLVEHRLQRYSHLDVYDLVDKLPTTPVAEAFVKNTFLCWWDGPTAKKCPVKCKQYQPSIVEHPLCQPGNAPDFDWVNVDKYVKGPGYGNCDSLYYLASTNPLFENKVFLENGMSFSSTNLQYTTIYFDIETFNNGAYNEIPTTGNKDSRIGVISMYIPSRNTLHLFTYTHYAYDVENIKSRIGMQNLTLNINTFAFEHSMCESFINILNDLPGLKLLSGFNSSNGPTTATNKPPGYDLPFILDRSWFVYHINTKFGVNMYHNYSNCQIMTVDILPQTYILDMSVLLYQNLTPDELVTIPGYALDDYLAMNSIAAKHDHDYPTLQMTLHTQHSDSAGISQIMAYCAYDAIALHLMENRRNLIASKLAYIDILNVPLHFVLYQTVSTLLKCHLMQLFVNAGYLPQYLAAATSVQNKGVYFK